MLLRVVQLSAITCVRVRCGMSRGACGGTVHTRRTRVSTMCAYAEEGEGGAYPLQQACSDFRTLGVQRYSDTLLWNASGRFPNVSNAFGMILEEGDGGYRGYRITC